MKVRIPDVNGENKFIENKKSIVLIGANGSGKTRMSVWIDENNPDIDVHRISAQKSLNMPPHVRPSELETAEEKFIYGVTHTNKKWLKKYGKRSARWGSQPEIYLLNDFEKLMEYLVTENYEKSIEYREKHKSGNSSFDNQTKLETIKAIWEDVILHRNMKICAGKIEVIDKYSTSSPYNGSQMSDGERAIFYYIGEVLSAKANSLIIIDEPENHLHQSILVRLWDAIESLRDDCTFIYITHNLDFASTRVDTQIIWVKNMKLDQEWEYQLIENVFDTDELMLEILGNRQSVLLIEGTADKSIDRKLYSKVYNEYNIIPLESCNAVIQAAKTYNNMKNFHHVNVIGLIDRDRRSNDEIDKLNRNSIYVPQVAEVENLFLLEEVISCVADNLGENKEEIISNTKDRVLEFLQNNIDKQSLLFVKQRCRNHILEEINKKLNTLEDYKDCICNISNFLKIDELSIKFKNNIQEIIDGKNYLEALKIINDKGLLPYTQLPNKFGWKKENYINYVIKLTGRKDKSGETLRKVFRKYISIP